MGRKSLETTNDPTIDDIDKACMALNLDEDQCSLVREAAESICTAKGPRGKKAPSEYNLFMGKCVKEKTGPVKERFKSCVLEWKKGER